MPKTVTSFSKVEHKHENLIVRLDYACVNMIYVTTHDRKALINMLASRKALKRQQVEFCQHLSKTSDQSGTYRLFAPAKSLLF